MWKADLMSNRSLVRLEADARRFCTLNGKIADRAGRVIPALFLRICSNDEM